MIHKVFALNLLFLVAVVSCRQFIIDTDAGSDDGVAISFFIESEKLSNEDQLIGVTAVDGNTGVDNVARNVLKILKTGNRLDIPVYKGTNSSIRNQIPSDNFFGNDGFGDFPFPDPPSEGLIKDEAAPVYLVQTVNNNPGEITIIALGPLTNIALAIRLDRHFFANVKEIFILGGSAHGEGNVHPGIEFNAFKDPEAMDIVFDEAEMIGKVVKLIPLETAKRSTISGDWRRNVLGTINNPLIKLLNQAERFQLNETEWQPTDTIPVILALNPQISKNVTNVFGQISTFGEKTRGLTIMDYDGVIQDMNKQIDLIENLNVQELKDILLKTFQGSSYVKTNLRLG